MGGENDGKDEKKIVDEDLNKLQQKYLHIHSEKNDKFEIPVIIHRAIYGSFERFIAVLSEHLLGKWPFWISPRQIKIVPTHLSHNDYAARIGKVFEDKGYWVDVDDSRDRMNNKIRKAQTAQFNFILVVGEKEQENETVNIRTRANEQLGEKTMEEALEWFDELVRTYQ